MFLLRNIAHSCVPLLHLLANSSFLHCYFEVQSFTKCFNDAQLTFESIPYVVLSAVSTKQC